MLEPPRPFSADRFILVTRNCVALSSHSRSEDLNRVSAIEEHQQESGDRNGAVSASTRRNREERVEWEANLERISSISHVVYGEHHAGPQYGGNGGAVASEEALGLYGAAGGGFNRHLLLTQSTLNGSGTPPPSYSPDF